MDKIVHLLAQYQVDVSPLPQVTTGPDRVQLILNVVFGIIGAISVLMFVIGGMRYITAQGDPSQISKAKQTILYSIIGVVVAILSVSIVTFVLGRV